MYAVKDKLDWDATNFGSYEGENPAEAVANALRDYGHGVEVSGEYEVVSKTFEPEGNSYLYACMGMSSYRRVEVK